MVETGFKLGFTSLPAPNFISPENPLANPYHPKETKNLAVENFST